MNSKSEFIYRRHKRAFNNFALNKKKHNENFVKSSFRSIRMPRNFSLTCNSFYLMNFLSLNWLANTPSMRSLKRFMGHPAATYNIVVPSLSLFKKLAFLWAVMVSCTESLFLISRVGGFIWMEAGTIKSNEMFFTETI